MMAKKKISLAAAAGSANAADAFVAGAPDMQGKQNKAAEKEFRLNVIIGAERSKALKMLAVERGQTIKELTLAMIDRELAK